jgi:hypothetical protein
VSVLMPGNLSQQSSAPRRTALWPGAGRPCVFAHGHSISWWIVETFRPGTNVPGGGNSAGITPEACCNLAGRGVKNGEEFSGSPNEGPHTRREVGAGPTNQVRPIHTALPAFSR